MLSLSLLLFGAGCGTKDGGGSPAGLPGTSGTASAVPGQAGVPTAGAKHAVDVDPLIPCRITPPGITVKSSHGHVKEVKEVRWYVNGSEAEIGPRLSATRFRRGDVILATVILLVDGAEVLETTPGVLAGNSPPAVAGVRIEPVNPVSGGTVRAVAEGSDADQDPVEIRFEWYVDNVLLSVGEEMALTRVKRGSQVHVRAVPNDGIVSGAWGESARCQVVNGLPVVKSQVPTEIPPGGKFVYRIEAEDPDGDPLSYTLKNAPPGMVLNGSVLEWQVPGGFFGRTVEIVVEIADGQGGTTVQKISMTILPPKSAAAPERRQEGM